MASEVIMPRQGQSVESCIILEWKKNEGDAVSEGDPIVEVETDKATFEVEATASGTLLKRFFEADDDVPVLTTIAVIGEPGEDYSGAISKLPDEKREGTETGPAGENAVEGEQAPADATPREGAPPDRPEAGRRGAVSPRALGRARREGVDPYGITGSGPGGRVVERDVAAAAAEGAPLTPAARDAAAAGAGHTPVQGTGIGGRVRSEDLRSTAEGGETAAPAGAGDHGSADGGSIDLSTYPGPYTEETARGVRKVIAERMYESLQSTAQLTLNTVADARALRRYRGIVKKHNAGGGDLAISMNDMILFAVSRVLRRYPEMNSHMEEYTLRRFEHVHLGFAVDTDKGLMVPTIRNADQRSLSQIAAESRRLAAACQSGKATQEDLVPGTFTITNLGNLGVTSFTPVIYPPQAGILGVGSIQPTPLFKQDGGDDDDVGFIPGLNLSLTMDHRAIDGAPAARFLQALGSALAEFELTLAE